MNTHIKIAPISPWWVVVALVVGMGIGYFLFSSPDTSDTDPHTHGLEQEGETTWTCSMHPQIRQNQPGACPICGMDLIPLEDPTPSDPLVLEMTPEAVKLAQIETMLLGEGTPRPTSSSLLALSGKIQADERQVASQVAHIPGRIEQLYISFVGETVKKGQKVARMYSPELVTAQKELIEAVKLSESYPELLEAARKKLAYWKIPQPQIEAIEKEGSIQENFDIRADVSGVVTQRHVTVGDHLMQGGSLFEVVNLDRVWVLFDAYEEDLSKVSVGDNISFTTPALPNKRFQTTLTFINPVIDPQTRVATLRGEVPNTLGALKPEMFVKGTLAASRQADAPLVVPKSAVLWTGKRSVIYVKVPDSPLPAFRFVEIQLGERLGDSYVVEEGLSPGDEIVIQGNFAIDAAAQLNNQRSMMNRFVGLSEASPQPAYPLTRIKSNQAQVDSVVISYLSLKDALVLSDSLQAQQLASHMLIQLGKIDQDSLISDAGEQLGKSLLLPISQQVEQIVNSTNLARQRDHFFMLSTELIELVKRTGSGTSPLYIQHCPMAQNYEGADWLSLEKEIRNPYFGDMMLTCGSVTGELIPAYSDEKSP